MAVESLERYVAAIWDWDFLAGAFANPRIRLSDIDGAVEVNGYHLYVEAKGQGVSLTGGQQLMFQRRITDGRSVVIAVWGPPSRPCAYEILGAMNKPEACDEASFRDVVTAWGDWAVAQPRPEVLPLCWGGKQLSRAYDPAARFSRN